MDTYNDDDLFLVDLDLYHTSWKDVEGKDLATGKSRRAFEALMKKFPKYMFEEQKCVDVVVPINGRISFEPIGKDEAAILQKYGTISGTGLDDIVLGMKSAHGRISCSWEDYMRYKELHHAELRRIGL